MAVSHFRMELNPKIALAPLQAHRRTMLIAGNHPAVPSQIVDCIRVAHPHLRLLGDPLEESFLLLRLQHRGPIFAMVAGLHIPAKLDIEQLHPIADTEHGNSVIL